MNTSLSYNEFLVYIALKKHLALVDGLTCLKEARLSLKMEPAVRRGGQLLTDIMMSRERLKAGDWFSQLTLYKLKRRFSN